MADAPWILLHPDGAADVYPAGWHVAADGTLGKAPLDLELRPQTLADGSTVAIVEKELVVTRGGAATCKLAVGEGRSSVVGAGGGHAAVASSDAVLVVDAAACQPVSIVGVAGAKAVAVDDQRVVAVDADGALVSIDWHTFAIERQTRFPSRCGGAEVRAEGLVIPCDGVLHHLPSGEPATPVGTPMPPRAWVIDRGVTGWALWDAATGERGTPPFGKAHPEVEMDAARRLAVGSDAAPRTGPMVRTASAYRVADGALLWTATVEGSGSIRVLEGAVLVVDRDGTARYYDRVDGHLIWTVRIDGPGLGGVVIEGDGRTCHAGEAACPPWTGRAPELPTIPERPSRHDVPKVAAGRAAAARDAAAPGFEARARPADLSAVPTVPQSLGAFEDCGATVESVTVPLRRTAPTLVLAGDDDGWRAPDGMDVLLLAPADDMAAMMNDGKTERDGSRRLAIFGSLSADDLPLGLRPGQGFLVDGDCTLLARGAADVVVEAAIRWAYGAVDRPLPTTVAAPIWTRSVRVGAVVALPGGGVGWSMSGRAGALDAAGESLWEHTGKELRLVADDSRIFEDSAGVVREIDPRTGATLREVPDARGARALVDGLLLVDLAGREQALLDSTTLAPRMRFAGQRYTTRLGPDGVTLSWGAAYTCTRAPEGAVRCSAKAPNSVALGTLTLQVDDGVLTATDKRGRVRWTIHGVAHVAEGPPHTAAVQLGSRSGQYALVDARGKLTTWLPVDSRPIPEGFGLAGDSTLVRWEP